VRLGHPSKFQQVSCLGFVTAPTLLSGGQPNFAQYLAISGLVHCICIFGGYCPLAKFFQVQNSLCIQVLHSPVLAALLHDTGAVCISQTVAVSREQHVYSQGGHHVGHWPTF